MVSATDYTGVLTTDYSDYTDWELVWMVAINWRKSAPWRLDGHRVVQDPTKNL